MVNNSIFLLFFDILVWYISELKKVLDRKTESFGLCTISSIIYNDDRNIPNTTAREGIQILVDAGANVDISDSKGI